MVEALHGVAGQTQSRQLRQAEPHFVVADNRAQTTQDPIGTSRMLSRLVRRRRMPNARGWAWLLTVIVVIAAGYGGWQHVRAGSGAASASQQPAQSPAPVHVATVERNDFPVVLNGLGTVQPTNTVTVRSRVDGQVEKVAFEEGQMVHELSLIHI